MGATHHGAIAQLLALASSNEACWLVMMGKEPLLPKIALERRSPGLLFLTNFSNLVVAGSETEQ